MRYAGIGAVPGTPKGHVSKVERELREYLSTLPWPWSIEPGTKHRRVVLAGKSIGVICTAHSKHHEKDGKQIMSAVKRRIRELEAM
jgi:hypothetical protein